MAEKILALVPAAGSGRRMGGPQAKQFLALAGRPILSHTLAVIEAAKEVVGSVVVARAADQDRVWQECVRPYGLGKVQRVVAGGARRQDSVAAGLAVCRQLGADLVVVHDGVRPLAGPELFAHVIAAARRWGAAICALPAAETIKQVDQRGVVLSTVERSRLWLVQTPQAFETGLLWRAFEQAAAQGWQATDEAGLVEKLGQEVRVVPGSGHNLKITTPQDLALAGRWLGGAAPLMGQGLDVHRLVPGRPLVLGGVTIEHDKGLWGHSDADVVCHALMDALLAAAGLGDIGQHFPDSDPAYKDISSLTLLAEVMALLSQRGLRPAQASVTLVAQAPRLAPHMEAMRRNLSQALDLDPGLVNLAATTSEGLGFTGRGEGIAALALASLRPREQPAEP